MQSRLVLCVMVMAACDAGTKSAPPAPAPPASPPASIAIDAPGVAAPDPWVPAPVIAVPAGEIEKLVESLKAMRRSKRGPGACLATGVDKSCTADADCTIVDVILDQCRTTAQIGVSLAAAPGLRAGLVDPCAGSPCPACVVRWMFTEDCIDSGDAVVRCVKGRCTTHNVAR